MGLIVFSQLVRHTRLRRLVHRFIFAVFFFFGVFASVGIFGQQISTPASSGDATSVDSVRAHATRSHRFLGGRTLSGNISAARAMSVARKQHLAMMAQQAASPELSNLNAPWQPVGPNQVTTSAYGNVTGRITAIAIDPADAHGNTVYIGTTGGGVWKSTNAADRKS